MNFVIMLLIGFSSWLWPMHFQYWESEGGEIIAPYRINTPALGWPGAYDGTVWHRVRKDIVLYNSPIYAENCRPLFDAEDEYRWFCTGKWKVPGPCRSHKDEAGLIHTTCVQCYSQADTGLYERIECPVMDVDELLEMTGQEVEP